uniref:Uncharacterized protein n=1 Tax=Globisporangium ultimum (strain ATCC 200006 / CBS 805.95 / DAOM BR144) TaxID=431595 RepID=K3X0P4_GLOUD
MPRQCFDCLNFQVATETAGCMVNTIGKCVPVTGSYNPADDYTRGVADNANGTTSSGSFGNYTDNPGLLFRADSVDYCDLTDTACAACRTAFVEASNSPNSKKRTTFCYGSGGCVCIAACESTRWSEIVGGKQCPTAAPTAVVLPPSPSPPPPPPPPHGMQSWEITLIAIAVLLAVLIGVILFKRNQNDSLPMWITRIVKKYRKSPEQAPQISDHDDEATGTPTGSASSQSSGNRAIGGPKREGLSLFGWRTMREELIDNENNKLAILEERSPQSGFVQFADTTPSAPAFEDEHADMPAAATRPTAPSIDM